MSVDRTSLFWALRYVFDRGPAEAAEAALILSYAGLVYRLAISRDAANDVSIQSLVTYAIVFWTRAWSRWQPELGRFGDITLTVLSTAVCVLLGLSWRQELGSVVEQPTLGSGFVQRKLGLSGRTAAVVAWANLYVLSLVVTGFMHWTTPADIIEDDLSIGVPPFLASFHQCLDTLAILPQFALFTSRATRDVPSVLVMWILGQAVCRCLALISGCFSIIILWQFNGGWNHSQLFFTAGQAFDLLVLSDFVYYYVRSRMGRGHGKAALFELQLPV